jgi:hypothetical protein
MYGGERAEVFLASESEPVIAPQAKIDDLLVVDRYQAVGAESIESREQLPWAQMGMLKTLRQDPRLQRNVLLPARRARGVGQLHQRQRISGRFCKRPASLDRASAATISRRGRCRPSRSSVFAS